MRVLHIMMMALVAGWWPGTAMANPPQDVDEVQGWTFYGRFQGTANESGVIMKLDPELGYNFNEHVYVYAGLPIYLVRDSAEDAPTGFVNGVGNVYAGADLYLYSSAIDFVSSLQVTAPTGDEDRGFSTGVMTVDWTNSISRTFGSFTPFGSVGIANTVSDTSFFVRPFTSDGVVGHFEGGGLYDFNALTGMGVSAYAIRASGEQRLVSRLQRQDPPPGRVRGDRVFERQPDTVGLSDIANDHGFAAWFNLSPHSRVHFQAGYNRSVLYDLDSVFWGLSFRVGK